MQINILAGGPTELWPDNIFEEPGQWIGADRGTWYLYQHQVHMKLAVGDFDSLTLSEYQELQQHFVDTQVIHVKAEKDETDTELALMYARDMQPTHIKVFGATGGRLDHLLSNLWQMGDEKFTVIREKVTFIDKCNAVNYFGPGEHVLIKNDKTRYLGFMALANINDFHIKDAKYTLDLNTTQLMPKMWSSNEFIGEQVHFSLKQGIIMTVQTCDV
ncbi:thiamine diphosphokinase [Leuconostoc fallax]|uniref:thiamine diphosphokinase n=1 Tax=Leuconostoc fallax TaxID=1251 RepID=UPI002090BEA0|nr:thiamine diphosphokinase [Leuconostoc fallax]MCO6183429.1 thiamine diphosphokinase [Leuconostoc fallax]